jgi:hypothetical protein
VLDKAQPRGIDREPRKNTPRRKKQKAGFNFVYWAPGDILRRALRWPQRMSRGVTQRTGIGGRGGSGCAGGSGAADD